MRLGLARVRVVKWGNSQAVRLPKSVLNQAKVSEGDELTIRVEGDRIAMERAAPQMKLEKLLNRITAKNRHREQDWGKPIGNEIW
jgi:antitoxin MazE